MGSPQRGTHGNACLLFRSPHVGSNKRCSWELHQRLGRHSPVSNVPALYQSKVNPAPPRAGAFPKTMKHFTLTLQPDGTALISFNSGETLANTFLQDIASMLKSAAAYKSPVSALKDTLYFDDLPSALVYCRQNGLDYQTTFKAVEITPANVDTPILYDSIRHIHKDNKIVDSSLQYYTLVTSCNETYYTLKREGDIFSHIFIAKDKVELSSRCNVMKRWLLGLPLVANMLNTPPEGFPYKVGDTIKYERFMMAPKKAIIIGFSNDGRIWAQDTLDMFDVWSIKPTYFDKW